MESKGKTEWGKSWMEIHGQKAVERRKNYTATKRLNKVVAAMRPNGDG